MQRRRNSLDKFESSNNTIRQVIDLKLPNHNDTNFDRRKNYGHHPQISHPGSDQQCYDPHQNDPEFSDGLMGLSERGEPSILDAEINLTQAEKSPFGSWRNRGGVVPIPYRKPRLRELPEEERPREKIREKGLSALSDSELLALILASGNRNLSVIELSRKLLEEVNGVVGLGKCDLTELMSLQGIGLAKAATILAAFELGKRRQLASIPQKRFHLPADLAEYVHPHLAYQSEEVFRVLFMDSAFQIITECEMFRGGLNFVSVDPRMIFRKAIHCRATKIVVCHNHPTGELTPSMDDYRITKRILEIGKLLDIAILDHLIISSWGYFSMSDEGVLAKLQPDEPNYNVIDREMRVRTAAQRLKHFGSNKA